MTEAEICSVTEQENTFLSFYILKFKISRMIVHMNEIYVTKQLTHSTCTCPILMAQNSILIKSNCGLTLGIERSINVN